MKATISVLTRKAVDQSFEEVGSQDVVLASDRLAVTPEIPPEAAGQELHLRVTPEDDVLVAIGQRLDAAIEGEAPAEPFVRGRYAAWGRKSRDIPMRAGDSIILSRPGPGGRP